LLRAASARVDAQYEALVAAPALLALARGGAALLATGPAMLPLGALAPALFAATLGAKRALGGTGVAIYALNALGGAIGAATAAFWLVERTGLPGSLAYGAMMLGVIGGVAAVASRSVGRVAPPGLAQSDGRLPPPIALPRWLLQLAALSGFGTFAAQSLFTQALGRVSNQSAYASGAVLVIALGCVGCGALFIYSLSRRARPQLALGIALAVTAAAFFLYPAAFFAATGGLSHLAVEAPWPAYIFAFAALAAATSAPVLLPAACVFPTLLAAAAVVVPRDGRSLAAAAGRLLAWNALGALVGAVLEPVALLPGLGLWGAVAIVGAAYLLGSLGPIARATSPRFAVYGALLGALIFAVARPSALPVLRTPRGERLVALEESAAGLVAVFENAGGFELQLDNRVGLGGSHDRVHWERQGHLPLLLHPNPKRVLFLGSATGSSASAALAHDVDAITLVESVPAIARAARTWFRGENRGVYEDPRTRVVADDARSFLRASPGKFDVIVGEPLAPWRAGAGALLSAEHFAQTRARLDAGGLFCQWLPLDQVTRSDFLLVARSFARVFPATDVFRGDFYGSHAIVAFCGSTRDAAFDPLREARALPTLADRWVSNPGGVKALYVGRLDPRSLADGPAETDAAPRIEFSAARAHSGVLLAPFAGVAWSELSGTLAVREETRGGFLLQAAGALFTARRFDEARQTFAQAAALLPPELVRDAPPDPSATELWHTLGD